MADKYFSIELHENTRVGRSLRILLGLACLVVTVWFMYSIRGTACFRDNILDSHGLPASLWAVDDRIGSGVH